MQETDFWQMVINTISEGLFMVGEDGRIREVNDSLCSLTGYAPEELLGQHCSIFACDACNTVRAGKPAQWCHLFSQKALFNRRCHITHKNGQRIPIMKNARLLVHQPATLGASTQEKSMFSVETITDLRELVQKDAYIEKVERLLHPEGGLAGIVGACEVMQKVFTQIVQAAQSTAPVMLTGESGTGKELAAKALHVLSPRKNQPFIPLNCAALNEHVLESELFGHVKGAFTGAFKDRMGRFEAASGGVLFLDEIGDIPLTMQVKILRVLENGYVERVGDNKQIHVDVRIVSATNRSIPSLIEQGTFREDLAYRINVIPVHLPPLRERASDIPMIVEHFLRIINELSGRNIQELSPKVFRFLMQHPWPGNVRQLRNVLEYAAVMSKTDSISMEHLPEYLFVQSREDPQLPKEYSGYEHPLLAQSDIQNMLQPAGGTILPATAGIHAPQRFAQTSPQQGPPTPQEREVHAIYEALALCNGNVSKAAQHLGIHRVTLINRMHRKGIQVSRVVNKR